MIFEGVFTALITPFNRENQIDFPCLERLLDRQLEAGVTGLVVMGTSGESPVIYGKEMENLVSFIIDRVGDQLTVIVGTGNNDTANTVAECRLAASLGAKGLMLVNPYYNKPTQEGLFHHFATAAAATDLPIMLYNIRGRTAVNLETATLLRLIANCSNINSVKEASGDLVQMAMVLRGAPANFSVLSGDDSLTLPLLALGGRGVVSVLGNLEPAVVVELVSNARNGNWERARRLHLQWLPMMEGLLSIGNNPLAVKALMSDLGLCQPFVRLPLYPLAADEKAKLHTILHECQRYC